VALYSGKYKHPGTLYAVSVVGRAFVKIGFTYRPIEERLRELQLQSPCPLKLLAIVRLSMIATLRIQGKCCRVEAQVKKMLSPMPHCGEWFAVQMDEARFRSFVQAALVILIGETSYLHKERA
jgi:hypothetical protein